MNYECEFRDFLIENLKEKFQIKDETNLLFYLFARYKCLFDKKDVTTIDFMQFVLRQLYILDESDGVVFQNIKFSYYFAAENSLSNIFDEWKFSLFNSMTVDLNGNKRNIEKEMSELISKVNKNAGRQILKYRSSVYKKEILKYFKLQSLNKELSIITQEVPDLNEVRQLDIRLSDEECLERYLHAETFNTTNTRIITESSLRDYLYINLDLIEAGLTPIGKEVPAQEGRIDILAKDAMNNYVILELKTEIDKRLIWQCLYYPEVLKQEHPMLTEPRVITICPEYPEYLYMVLKRLPNVELFQYKMHSTNCKIEDIQISKL